MKFLFKRKLFDTTDTSTTTSLRTILLIKSLQRLWADWMDQKTASFSKTHWILIVIIFLLLGGGFSSYIIFSSLKSRQSYSFKIQELQKYDLLVAPERLPDKQSVLEQEELRKLERYRNYLDSLAKTSTGKPLYDSITKGNPELMGNLERTIKFYKYKLNQ